MRLEKEIRFSNEERRYIATHVYYEIYKGSNKCAYVKGHYSDTDRKMPTKLFRDKKTNRPCLYLGGKMFAENIEDNELIPNEILEKADIK